MQPNYLNYTQGDILKLYYDESGNTGFVELNKKYELNYGNQKYFTYGSYFQSTTDTTIEKYKNFKEMHKSIAVDCEIKGNDLLINSPEHNAALSDFIETILDRNNFQIIFYDKRYYLVTLALAGILGPNVVQYNIYDWYLLTEYFYSSDAGDELIKKYLSLSESESRDSDYFDGEELYLYITLIRKRISKFLEEYTKDLPIRNNTALETLDKSLQESVEQKFRVSRFATLLKGSYGAREKNQNLINLNALGELYLFQKDFLNIDNKQVAVQIDPIHGIQDVIIDELDRILGNLNFSFTLESKDSIGLQIADNIASIYRKLADLVLEIGKEKIFSGDLSAAELFVLEHYSKLCRKIKNGPYTNIKNTTFIENQAILYIASIWKGPEDGERLRKLYSAKKVNILNGYANNKNDFSINLRKMKR